MRGAMALYLESHTAVCITTGRIIGNTNIPIKLL
jgi:hypothetical protein